MEKQWGINCKFTLDILAHNLLENIESDNVEVFYYFLKKIVLFMCCIGGCTITLFRE